MPRDPTQNDDRGEPAAFHLHEITRFHADIIEPYSGRPVGCTREEVDALERKIGYPLPEAYREYLYWMGNDRRGIFRGCDWFLGDALPNTADLPGLLAYNRIEFPLPSHYLVFFSHQGYMAAWFALPKASENPPCYFFTEGGPRGPDGKAKPPTIAGTFTDVLFEDMKGMASASHKDEMIKKGYLSAG